MAQESDANGNLRVTLRDADNNPINPAAPVLAANEAHIGQVGGHTVRKVVTPTIQAAAYAAGNVVGGVQTLSAILRAGGPFTGVWQSLLITDKSGQKPALEILIFNGNPTQGTYTDKAACPSFATNTTDLGKLIRRVSVAASDYVTVGSVAIADLSMNGRVLAALAADLYFLPVIGSGGSATFTGTTDLSFAFGVLLD